MPDSPTLPPTILEAQSREKEEEDGRRIGNATTQPRSRLNPADSAASGSPGRLRDANPSSRFTSSFSAIVTPSESPTQETVGNNIHLTNPGNVPHVSGLSNSNSSINSSSNSNSNSDSDHLASMVRSERDQVDRTWKGIHDSKTKYSQETPTDDDVTIPVSATITPDTGSPFSASPPRSGSIGSDIQPLPLSLGGQSSLRRTGGDSTPRFVTSGGPLDPIPPPRSSLTVKNKSKKELSEK